MRLFLIRHGETVDNVAQVYAGVKDSALTNHGNLQAERLGKFLAKSGLRFTHIFSSDLQRAIKTAGALQSWNDAAQPGSKLQVTALKALREQDFGYYEGKPFHARPRDSSKSGKETHRSQHHNDPDFVDVESKESMTARMEKFIQEHLVPLIHNEARTELDAIAVVSHGIILSHLWRSFLKLLPKDSVSLSPGVSIGSGGITPLEYLGGWSNTGYLDLKIREDRSKTSGETTTSSDSSQTIKPDPPAASIDSPFPHYTLTIMSVNSKEHLQGLKRTKGGVGSSKFDEDQKSIESFFKKRKVTTDHT